MNAAKAKKNPAKFKGAVLIMILAVMSVLIILLAGSIAVVYSAHNRAFVKYTESQGYYTARSILDNFYDTLNNTDAIKDSTNNDIGEYYKLDDDTYSVVETPAVKLSIQRAIELDTYRAIVKVTDDSGAYLDWFVKYCDKNKESLSTMINGFETTSVDYTTGSDGNRTSLYNKVATYLVNLNKTELDDYSTYSKYYDQYLPVTSVASTMQGNTIVYELGSLDGFGEGTIDTDGDGNPDTYMQLGNLADSGVEKAWVTVEVKERILSMGEGTKYGERFRTAGNHFNDYFVAKVTSHVLFNGEEMTTSLIWRNDPPQIDGDDMGMCNLGPLDTTTSFTAVGNAATLTDSFLELGNNSTYTGDVYIEGSFDTGTATPYVMTRKTTAFYVGDTLKINTNPPADSVLEDGSLFYAGRTQLWSSGSSFGSSSHKINLITKQFESHSDTKEFYGRIFADKFDVTTNGGQKTQSSVATEITSGGTPFPNSNKRIYGDVYCNFLGVPADRVYIEYDDTNAKAIIHLNYNPNGTPLASTDSRCIENMVGSGNSITVLQGISIITAVDNETIGGRTVLVNKHETYTHNGDTYDYFRDVDAAPSGAPGTKFETLDSTTVKANQAPSGLITYSVSIDWSNVSSTIKHPFSSHIDLMDYIDYDADISDSVWTFDDDYKKEFNLPIISGTQVTLVGTNQSSYKLPTHRSLYGKYFFDTVTGGTSCGVFPKTFDDDTARFSMDPSDTSQSFTFNDFLKDHVIPGEYYANDLVDDSTPMSTVAKSAVDAVEMPLLSNEVVIGPGGGDTVNGIDMPSSSSVISSDGYIKANSSDSTKYFIDARNSNIKLQLGNGTGSQTFTGTFIVYGDKTVELIIPGKTGGGNTQTVELGTSGCPFTFMNEEIYSGDSKDVIVLGEVMPGKHGGTKTAAPSINIYVSRNISTVKFQTGGGGMTALCGYIKAPYSFFDIATNINGIQKETYYYKRLVYARDNDKYTFFGSVLCLNYKGGQHAGICGIGNDELPPDDGVTRAYTPHFDFGVAY